MLIAGSKKFISAAFTNESELECVVQANSEYIFGPDSIYLPKSLIRTSEGFGTIPDGFVVDLSTRTWFIVEAELAIHSVWNHIAPQIAKQMIASGQASSRRMLTELVINRVKEDAGFRDKFEELGIADIDIRRVLSEIFEKKPVIGLPIDHIRTDLREWAQTLKSEVKLWLIRKLVEFGNPANVIYEIPEEFRPTLDTSPDASDRDLGFTTFNDVTMSDLLAARFLTADEKLHLSYAPRGMDRRTYEGTVLPDGSLEVLGRTFAAPSYAALLCLKHAGSSRNTVNGWTSWRNESGRTLAELRDDFMQSMNFPSNGANDSRSAI